MRLLVGLMTVLLFLGILGFVLTNLDTRVGVTIWNTEYPEVPLFAVVILSILAGVVYAGVIAVAEGASIRLVNRRLGREARRLESELNYLRTQPEALQPREADAPGLQPETPDDLAERVGEEAHVATAPVYDSDSGEWVTDPADDAYSGGRAV